VWELNSQKEILTLDGHTREVTSVTFSPDGSQVLTGSQDGRAILWLTMDWKKWLTVDEKKLDGQPAERVAAADKSE
jgi:WD40 repeat protein